jgi:vacuolar-type H+-ATPase subunit E/Vma4
MSLDHLIAALERDAATEAQSELDKAHREAARIARETEEALARRRLEYRHTRETEVHLGLERALAQARKDGRQEVLKARERLLETVFSRAARRLAEASHDPDFLDSLPARLERAARYLGGRPALVLCPPALAGHLEELLRGRQDLRLQVDPSLGPGIRLRAEDGSVEIDETLGGALERLRPHLALEVIAHLSPLSRERRVVAGG